MSMSRTPMHPKSVRYLPIFVLSHIILQGSHAFPFRAVICKNNPAQRKNWRNILSRPIIPNSPSIHRLNSEPMQLLENDDANTSEDLPFDDETWEAYYSVVVEVMASPRVLKKEKPEDLQVAKEFLLSKRSFSSVPSPLTDGEAFDDKMKQQKELFTEHYKLSIAQYDYAMRCLVYMGDNCAKRRSARPIAVAWHKMKESGMIPRENCISTYMYVLSTDESCGDALGEVATSHDLFFSPNEKTVTLRIKTLIGKNDVDKAEEILASLPVRYLVFRFQPILLVLTNCLVLFHFVGQRGGWRVEKTSDISTSDGTLL